MDSVCVLDLSSGPALLRLCLVCNNRSKAGPEEDMEEKGDGHYHIWLYEVSATGPVLRRSSTVYRVRSTAYRARRDPRDKVIACSYGPGAVLDVCHEQSPPPAKDQRTGREERHG